LPIRSCFSQLLRDPRISRRARHIHMDDFPRLQLNDKESKKRTKEKIGHLQEIASLYLCRMVAQERPPILPAGPF
jgi:hypothetical protein